MNPRTKVWLNRIRKAIPIIYLAIYIPVWVVFVRSLDDVVSGEKYLMPEFEYNLSQLTAYFEIVMLALFIWIGYVLIKKVFTPDRSLRYRIARLERELSFMKDMVGSQSDMLNGIMDTLKEREDEGDIGDSDGESDTE